MPTSLHTQSHRPTGIEGEGPRLTDKTGSPGHMLTRGPRYVSPNSKDLTPTTPTPPPLGIVWSKLANGRTKLGEQHIQFMFHRPAHRPQSRQPRQQCNILTRCSPSVCKFALGRPWDKEEGDVRGQRAREVTRARERESEEREWCFE